MSENFAIEDDHFYKVECNSPEVVVRTAIRKNKKNSLQRKKEVL